MNPRSKKANHVLRMILGTTAAVVLLSVVVGTCLNFGPRSTFSFYPLTQRTSSDSVDLSEGWEFALVKKSLSIEELARSNVQWRPFDVRKPNQYGDVIEGHYWLRKRFQLTQQFIHPSIVLGLVANHHRTFVNNFFVGGSDYWEHVAQYSIDPKVMSPGGENTILVKAFTPKTYQPGLRRLGHVGVKIAEFGDIQRVIQMDSAQYFVVRTLYLVVTFITAIICLVFFFFNPTRKYLLYFSIYLGLGSLSLMYYNFYVVTALNYSFHRFIKVFSLGLGSFILCSTFFYNRKMNRIELASNVGAIVFSVAAFLLLLVQEVPVSVFRERYNMMFKFTSMFTLIWVIPALILVIRSRMNKYRSERRSFPIFLYQLMVVSSGFLLALLCLSSSGLLKGFDSLNFIVINFGVAHSFLFSLLVFVIGCYEHIKSLKRLEFESQKNRFNLEMVRVLNQGSDLKSTVYIIQERMCELVGCERSTIYLVEDESRNEFLEASFIYGEHRATSLVQKVIPKRSGLIGRVLETKKSLLVKNIDKLEGLTGGEARHYKTKSCMVVPLIVENEFVGVITVADKKNGRPFSQRNLGLIEGVAKDLALLCKVSRLKNSLQQQLDGTISALAKMIEKRDPYTEFHSQGVMYLTEKIAIAVGIPVTNELKIAAFLHDVGKVFVPIRVLNKPGPLNPKEWEYIKQHSQWSSDILKNIPGFEQISLWAGLHHESIDGKGYPYGLTEDLIPFEAQVISVADYIDALATNRAYRPKFDYETVEKMLREMGKENRFRAELVEAGVQVLHDPDFRKLYSERGASYRPESSENQTVFEFYMEPFDDFSHSLEELNKYLKGVKSGVSYESLNSTVGSIRSLGNQLTKLASQLNRLMVESEKEVAS